MDPARDILSGANRHLYAAGLGITLTGTDGASVSLCPLDHPLISLDTPGMWKFSLDFVPRKPTVFLNLYNNQWNTNYRYWYPGTWSSRVRVWLANDLAVPALEARVPLLAASGTGPGGKLPAVQRGVSVSRPGVLVTAFGSSTALKGTLFRIWEVAGKSGKVVVEVVLAVPRFRLRMTALRCQYGPSHRLHSNCLHLNRAGRAVGCEPIQKMRSNRHPAWRIPERSDTTYRSMICVSCGWVTGASMRRPVSVKSVFFFSSFL